MKKNKTKISKSLKTRRTFLKSTSMFITGISVLKPTSIFEARELSRVTVPLIYAQESMPFSRIQFACLRV